MAIKLDEARVRLLKVSGGVEPTANNSLNLGTSSYKWKNVYATTFTGDLSGNAATATKATQDGSGNVITSKYVTLDTSQTISGAKVFQNTVNVGSVNTGNGTHMSNQGFGIYVTTSGGWARALAMYYKNTSESHLYSPLVGMYGSGENVSWIYFGGTNHTDNWLRLTPTATLYTTKSGDLGTSSYKWANVYATNFRGALIGNVTGNLTGNVTGNVSGSSGSCTGNAATATTLANGRTLKVNLASTSASTAFNGSTNITDIGVSGILPIANGGTGSNTRTGTINNLGVFGLFSRTDVGTSPNFDNPGINGFFEMRSSSETTGETGTKPYDGFAPFISLFYSNAAFQLAGTSANGFYIRGIQKANVNLSGIAWQKLLTSSNYSSYALPLTGGTLTNSSSSYGLLKLNATAGSESSIGYLLNGTNYWTVGLGPGGTFDDFAWYYSPSSAVRLRLNKNGTITTTGSIVVKGNGSSYNECLRVLPASNGWSNCFFSADDTTSGAMTGGWLIGRRGSTGTYGSVGDFIIEHANSVGSGLTLTQGGTLRYMGLMHFNGGLTCNRGSNNHYQSSALEIREYNYSGAGGDTWGQAPRLSFHWSGRVAAQIGLASNGSLYINNHAASSTDFHKIWVQGDSVTGAVWNDYAEYRESDCSEPGRVLIEKGDDTLTMSTEHMQPFAGIVSDTWGFCQGETETAKTPIAVAGRVLVYTNKDRNTFKPGDVVCAGPNGTVEKMSRNEIIQFPDRIVGTVSCVPEYETWGSGDRDPVQVNGRIWIKVR